jgi:polyhydroxybutyrate depolymerase
MRKFILGSLLLLAIAGISAAFILKWDPLHPLHSDTVMVDSLTREFSYHLPSHISAHPRLIFVLHGSTGSPAIMQMSTGHEFDRLADTHGDAIIVYPAGYHGYWNDCRKKGTYESKKLNLDDVAFFGKMIAYFKSKYQIDTAAVFAMGFSNGGHMCYKLAKEKPLWFRGIAAVSANLPMDENNDCYDLHLPISVLVMNGTGDPINPYGGGEVSSRRW